eukprot:6199528-Pleurochrysis_carterae.AAC.2
MRYGVDGTIDVKNSLNNTSKCSNATTKAIVELAGGVTQPVVEVRKGEGVVGVEVFVRRQPIDAANVGVADVVADIRTLDTRALRPEYLIRRRLAFVRSEYSEDDLVAQVVRGVSDDEHVDEHCHPREQRHPLLPRADVLGPLVPRPPHLVAQFMRVYPKLKEVGHKGGERREREGDREQRHEAVLYHLGVVLVESSAKGRRGDLPLDLADEIAPLCVEVLHV